MAAGLIGSFQAIVDSGQGTPLLGASDPHGQPWRDEGAPMEALGAALTIHPSRRCVPGTE